MNVVMVMVVSVIVIDGIVAVYSDGGGCDRGVGCIIFSKLFP